MIWARYLVRQQSTENERTLCAGQIVLPPTPPVRGKMCDKKSGAMKIRRRKGGALENEWIKVMIGFGQGINKVITGATKKESDVLGVPGGM